MSCKESTGSRLGAIGVALALIPFAMLLRAWGLQKLWTWFIVPLGAVAIGMAHAYGIAVFTSLLLGWVQHRKDDDEDESAWVRLLSRVAIGVLASLLAVGIGWCAHEFMG